MSAQCVNVAGASLTSVLRRTPAHCQLSVSEPAALPGHHCAPHLCAPGERSPHSRTSHRDPCCPWSLQLLLPSVCAPAAQNSTCGHNAPPSVQAVALRETQLQTLVDDLDGFVHSSALASAAWLAQIDGLIFPHRYMAATRPGHKAQEHVMPRPRQRPSRKHAAGP